MGATGQMTMLTSDQIIAGHVMELRYLRLCNTPSNINEHLPLLRQLAMGSYHVVEFGTAGGRSLTAILLGEPVLLETYDIVKNPAIDDLLALNTKRLGECYEGQHRAIIASTLEIEPVSCDLLFIDDEHTYDQVSKELARHAKGVRKTICFHDTVSYPEVNVAIDDFLKTEEGLNWTGVFHALENNGFRIIARKDS